jgi:hypothetical protein
MGFKKELQKMAQFPNDALEHFLEGLEIALLPDTPIPEDDKEDNEDDRDCLEEEDETEEIFN